MLAAHTTLLTPEEALLLRDRGAAVSYNPVATFWKGNAVAPATLLSALGVRMGLGTDGTRGDAFRLLDAAETAQRLGSAMAVGDPYAGRGRRWLRAGTQGGADALGLGAVVGRISRAWPPTTCWLTSTCRNWSRPATWSGSWSGGATATSSRWSPSRVNPGWSTGGRPTSTGRRSCAEPAGWRRRRHYPGRARGGPE